MGTRKQKDYRNYEKCNCIVCGRTAQKKAVGMPDGVHFHCMNCGDFYVTEEFQEDNGGICETVNGPMLAGYIRERFECGDDEIWISNENIQDIINSPLIPQTPSEKIKKLVCYMDIKSETFSQDVQIPYYETAICYAKSGIELNQVIHACVEEGYIFVPDSSRFKINNEIRYSGIMRLTLKGHQYAEELRKTESNSNSAFVAMWFSKKVRDAYESGIKAAIEAEECGQFKAFRVDNLEHNNDVTDEIIAGIKEARFVVADLTGNRGGVYYEAGFAKGLGKPVILTCRRDWFNGPGEGHKVHFDVNHFNIIVWETPEDLKTKLINRIRATVL